MMRPENRNFDHYRKAARVAFVLVVALSVTGFFIGLRQTANSSASRELASYGTHAEAVTADTAEAVDYSKMGEFPKPNHGWSNSVASLRSPEFDLPDLHSPPTESQREESLAARLSRRAYDGAPPVIPHPIEQISAASCISCHGDGKVVKGRVASKISHQHYSNCTQCHVPSSTRIADSPPPVNLPPFAPNTFKGLPGFGRGARAYEGAPPTIPHPTSMRLNCNSCHGPGGTAALKTSHPWRQSCTQCHAPDAGLDQRNLQSELTRNLAEQEILKLLAGSAAASPTDPKR